MGQTCMRTHTAAVPPTPSLNSPFPLQTGSRRGNQGYGQRRHSHQTRPAQCTPPRWLASPHYREGWPPRVGEGKGKSHTVNTAKDLLYLWLYATMHESVELVRRVWQRCIHNHLQSWTGGDEGWREKQAAFHQPHYHYKRNIHTTSIVPWCKGGGLH